MRALTALLVGLVSGFGVVRYHMHRRYLRKWGNYIDLLERIDELRSAITCSIPRDHPMRSVYIRNIDLLRLMEMSDPSSHQTAIKIYHSLHHAVMTEINHVAKLKPGNNSVIIPIREIPAVPLTSSSL